MVKRPSHDSRCAPPVAYRFADDMRVDLPSERSSLASLLGSKLMGRQPGDSRRSALPPAGSGGTVAQVKPEPALSTICRPTRVYRAAALHRGQQLQLAPRRSLIESDLAAWLRPLRIKPTLARRYQDADAAHRSLHRAAAAWAVRPAGWGLMPVRGLPNYEQDLARNRAGSDVVKSQHVPIVLLFGR